MKLLPLSSVFAASTQEVIHCTFSLLCAEYGVDNWITLATKYVALLVKEKTKQGMKKVQGDDAGVGKLGERGCL